MGRRLWWVVPLLRPDKRIAGPFETRDEAECACLRACDPTEAARVLADGRWPAHYTVRPLEVEIEVQHYKGPVAAVVAAPITPVKLSSVKLPAIVYSYTRGALLLLCLALDLPAPPPASNREGILAHIEQELGKLA